MFKAKMFNVRRFGGFIVNFEHISHLCSSVSFVNFEHGVAGWDCKFLNIRYLLESWILLWEMLTKIVPVKYEVYSKQDAYYKDLFQ